MKKDKNLLPLVVEIIRSMETHHWDYGTSKKLKDEIGNIKVEFHECRTHISFIVPNRAIQKVPKMSEMYDYLGMKNREEILEMYVENLAEGFSTVTIKIPALYDHVNNYEYRSVKNSLKKILNNISRLENDYDLSLKRKPS